MGVVRHMCKNIAIMHRGRFVEQGRKEDVYEAPAHIYTKRLMAAIPDSDPDMYEANRERREAIAKEYDSAESVYYGKDGRVFDLRHIKDEHYAAIPE
jgi:peptide/nickel transport system ATP-binding protein